jgi:hypothetical protein
MILLNNEKRILNFLRSFVCSYYKSSCFWEQKKDASKVSDWRNKEIIHEVILFLKLHPKFTKMKQFQGKKRKQM